MCESAAGGLISAALLAVLGASAYYFASGVVYTHDARRGVLGLSGDQVTMQGASEEFADIMARTICEKVGATWAVGEAGAASPTGNRYGHDAGHVTLAVVGPGRPRRYGRDWPCRP